MGPTINDVARLANTSKSTVSRFLNGRKVKKPTQEALEKVINELNFRRNANARRLVLDKTHTIGIIVDDISNIFYSGIIRGIESVAKRKGYNCVFLSRSSNLNNEISFLDLLYEGQADGIILVSFQKRELKDLQRIKEDGAPVVLIGDHGEIEGLCAVDVDNSAGIAEIAAYLHSIGHRNIGYIAGPDSASASRYRFKGYKQSLEELNLTYNPEWVAVSDWSNESGYKAMKKLIANPDISAVIASNDETAIGALRAVQENGKNVPKDVSVVGFDDIATASWVYPSLTTVRQPFREIGVRAAEGLFNKIEGAAGEGGQSYLLKPELIIRDSCRKI